MRRFWGVVLKVLGWFFAAAVLIAALQRLGQAQSVSEAGGSVSSLGLLLDILLVLVIYGGLSSICFRYGYRLAPREPTVEPPEEEATPPIPGGHHYYGPSSTEP